MNEMNEMHDNYGIADDAGARLQEIYAPCTAEMILFMEFYV